MKRAWGYVRALFGVGATEYQAKMPPLGFLVGLVVVAYFSAELVQWISVKLGPWAVYLRIPGTVAVGMVGHELYRMIRYQDGLTVLGWIRRVWMERGE